MLLRLIQENDNPRSRGIVKQIFRQVYHAFNKIILNKPFAALLFFIASLISTAAAGGACIQYNASSSCIIQAAVNMLYPAPVNLAPAGACREALHFIINKKIVIDIR